MKLDITGLVLTYNGQKYLDRTLASLDFCSRLLVVDSGSKDETLAIARSHGAEVVHNAWNGAIEQHRFAWARVATPWLVTLDQDEWLSDAARENLTRALADPGENVGFFLPRRSFYFDRYIRHSGWYPDYLLRAFRPESVTLGGTPPHEEFSPNGPTRHLAGDIVHHPYEGFGHHLDKINAYTDDAAQALFARGATSSLGKAYARGVGKFLKQYVLKKGFLDGKAGFILAVHAFVYAFEKYAKLLELHRKAGRS